jgi:hypothetical protein
MSFPKKPRRPQAKRRKRRKRKKRPIDCGRYGRVAIS